MIGVAMALMLQSAPVPVSQDDSANVDGVTVTASGKSLVLPAWSRQVRAIGWPLLGLSQDKTVLMFAKTGKAPAGLPYQRVWVRHEFRLKQIDAEAAPPLAYHSERLAQDVDCETRTYRSLAAYRYPENNLGGEVVAFAIESREWIKPEAETFDESVIEATCMRLGS